MIQNNNIKKKKINSYCARYEGAFFIYFIIAKKQIIANERLKNVVKIFFKLRHIYIKKIITWKTYPLETDSEISLLKTSLRYKRKDPVKSDTPGFNII